MAVVDIEVENFTKSEVPPVCVFSGIPSENVFRFRFDGVTGGLPVNGDVLMTLARLRKVIFALAAASVLCFAFSFATGVAALSLLAVGFMVVALATTLVARKRLVKGTVVGDKVRLQNVHPAFVDAVTGPGMGKCKTCPTFADCPSHTGDEIVICD